MAKLVNIDIDIDIKKDIDHYYLTFFFPQSTDTRSRRVQWPRA